MEELLEAITEKSTDSKILRADLKMILEDQRGIVVREAIYD